MQLDSWLAFMATTQGRDKFYRTVQYFARFVSFYLAKIGRLEYASRLAVLSASVGTARKCMCVWAITFSVPHRKAAGPCSDNLADVGRAGRSYQVAGDREGHWLWLLAVPGLAPMGTLAGH